MMHDSWFMHNSSCLNFSSVPVLAFTIHGCLGFCARMFMVALTFSMFTLLPRSLSPMLKLLLRRPLSRESEVVVIIREGSWGLSITMGTATVLGKPLGCCVIWLSTWNSWELDYFTFFSNGLPGYVLRAFLLKLCTKDTATCLSLRASAFFLLPLLSYNLCSSNTVRTYGTGVRTLSGTVRIETFCRLSPRIP